MRHSDSSLFSSRIAVGFILAAISSACQHAAIEDSSSFALTAGQATMILGSDCSRPLELGYSSCQLRVEESVPTLNLTFMNAAEYAVSDCDLGIHKTGSVSDVHGGIVEVDLSGLTEQVQKQRFCFLRIEAVERYADPLDPQQMREIPLAGGFFIEVLDQGYLPHPSNEVISWCYQVSGTNKGRRKMEPCK